MSRRQPASAASQTAPADSASHSDEAQSGFASSVAAILVALLGLASAVAAVAKFPNQPVPASLVGRIDVAQLALSQAVASLLEDDVDLSALMGVGDGVRVEFDLETEIKRVTDATFESLNGELKARFDAIDAQAKERFDALEARFVEAAEHRKDSAEILADRFTGFEERLDKLEQPVAPAEAADQA